MYVLSVMLFPVSSLTELQAPVSLASSLQEYLNDPNFEQNRIEYKASKAAGNRIPKGHDGGSSQAPRGIVSIGQAHLNFVDVDARYLHDINKPGDYRNIGQTSVPPSRCQ